MLHKKGIVCELILPFLLRKQSLAARKKLNYSVLRFVLLAMAVVVNRGQVPKPVLSAMEQGR
jgi:hypothetical protein